MCLHAAAANVCVLGFFGEPGVRVLDLCAEATPTPLLLTYNTSTQQYSIGALLPATSEVSALKFSATLQHVTV